MLSNLFFFPFCIHRETWHLDKFWAALWSRRNRLERRKENNAGHRFQSGLIKDVHTVYLTVMWLREGVSIFHQDYRSE